uniref:Uncharacterized protein n=1 Tax=Euphorbia pulcherrima TaxID=37495 RepID=A5Y598_EUPPU|nr:unknown [Euphorbia pulcherrima]
MAPIIFLFLLATLLANPFSLLAHKPHISSRISVVGGVYCDTCSTKSFSKHSYFLPGVDVHIQCKFEANSARTAEQINFTVNRTTDKYGIYKLEIGNVDGIDCVDSTGIAFLCQATVLNNSNSACKVPQLRTTSDQITVKSKQDNHCIYSLNALSYKPRTINDSLCSQKNELENNNNNFSSPLNSSKFFFPFFSTFLLASLYYTSTMSFLPLSTLYLSSAAAFFAVPFSAVASAAGDFPAASSAGVQSR